MDIIHCLPRWRIHLTVSRIEFQRFFLLNKLVKWFAFNGLLFLFPCVLLFRTIMCPKFGEPLCTASDLETSEVLRTTFHGYD